MHFAAVLFGLSIQLLRYGATSTKLALNRRLQTIPYYFSQRRRSMRLRCSRLPSDHEIFRRTGCLAGWNRAPVDDR